METASATKTLETSFIGTSFVDGYIVGSSNRHGILAPGVYFDMTSQVPSAPEGYKVASVRVVSTLVTTFEPSVPVTNKELMTFTESLLKVLKITALTTLNTISDDEVHVLDVDGNEILAIKSKISKFFDVQFYRPGSKKCDTKCKVTDRFGIERCTEKYGYSCAAIVDARLTEDGKIMCSNLRIHSFGQFMHQSPPYKRDEIDLATKLGSLKCLDKVPDPKQKRCLSYFCKEHCDISYRSRPSDDEETVRVAKKARVGNKQRVAINYFK